MIQILKRTDFGTVFKCDRCNKLHVEFNNFNLNFTPDEFHRFSRYIRSLDGEYLTEINSGCVYRRKIYIPLSDNSINLLLNEEELCALREMLRLPAVSVTDELTTAFRKMPSMN